ncbi:hypothetical protein Tsubulata_033336 [Turnera subulata]|uniref:BTB domain-containing protein n=1 Tax=Turnera subulata TaxID=218843 RepID=A0A9Q0GI44_9ROSI|nr:hypothetical protein Tsubulata_033336 [Turnera subulata]
MGARKVATRRSLKRKLEQQFQNDQPNHKTSRINSDSDSETESVIAHPYETEADLARDLRDQVSVLNSAASSSASQSDRAAAKRAIRLISEVAKNEKLVDLVIDSGAVPVLVTHLQSPSILEGLEPCDYEVKKWSAIALGVLAYKPEHQQLIVDAGALPHLIYWLKRHEVCDNLKEVSGVIRNAADAINNLAHENAYIKNIIRIEGGIPPLVDLLRLDHPEVRRAAAGALRTLAFRNEDNKNQIVECDALPTLVPMLLSEDTAIHHEAVGVIGNLVHSSPNIKKLVLLAGALQPVIGLLSSSCIESQREAALLLGQFATDSDCKVHIVQRGALRPLIDMLDSSDEHLKEMAAFALGRLAQERHNQAGIAYNGGIVPLLKLLKSKNGSLQHNAVFTLYGLVDNEDNIADLIKLGAFQKLLDGKFTAQGTKDCVVKTLKRLEEKIHGYVLNHLMFLMRTAEKAVQRQIALVLAHLCAPDAQKTIFLDNNGLELLLGLLESGNKKQQCDCSVALHKLATKVTSASLIDEAPLSPNPQVYLGAQYVNNPTLSDITFIVEGKRFYAHRICLLASSDAFRAMFDGGYRERNAEDVEIPNIRWDVFELMMRFIYTGSVQVNVEIAQDLLRAADQYLLDGLKRLCEYAIAKIVGRKSPSWNTRETDWVDLEADLYHWTKALRPVQWYPGHIAKTEKELKDQLKLMDVVIEVRDARIPLSTTHPQMDSWLGNRRRILVLNREDMISKADRNAWATYFARQGVKVVFSNGQLGLGAMKLGRLAKSLAASVNVKRRAKGLLPRPVRAGIVGYPNVGKSSLINRLLKRRMCPAAPRPGVTRELKWVRFGKDLELLDSPGIIPMRISDQSAAIKLAICDDIGERSYDVADVAAILVQMLTRHPSVGIEALQARYRMDVDGNCGGTFVHKLALHLFNGDTHQAAFRILADFRKGKFGWIALERPPR